MSPLESNIEFEAFSPRIVSTLIVGGDRINVRSTCDAWISVEADRAYPPTDATLQMVIGDDVEITELRLLDGIDPARDEQPIRILSED